MLIGPFWGPRDLAAGWLPSKELCRRAHVHGFITVLLLLSQMATSCGVGTTRLLTSSSRSLGGQSPQHSVGRAASFWRLQDKPSPRALAPYRAASAAAAHPFLFPITPSRIADQEYHLNSAAARLQLLTCWGPGLCPWGAERLDVHSWTEAPLARHKDELLPRRTPRGHLHLRSRG